MKDRISDKKLVNLLKQYRPNVPEAAPDFEQKLLAAIDRNDATAREFNYLRDPQFTRSSKRSGIVGFPKWAFPSAIAAGLLVFLSGYPGLVPGQFHADEAARLEAFLVNNWEGVLNDSPGENSLDRPQTDWLTFSYAGDTEPATNN
ncbi:hypothetical protein QUB56_32710 [Microcoleus sp. AR_TQ3_B6]|uniref:hypothetical protein n=1 Tax=Microcoleus sp. AR_TQ3_B6 TaxID=3055284 RepID=UPI002FD402EB